MSTTTFTNGVTVTDADWFNDLDRLLYDILDDPADMAGLMKKLVPSVTEKSTDYTFVLADGNQMFVHPSSDDNPRTFTIPANSSVAYPNGTSIIIVNEINSLTVAITSDTLTLAGANTTGSVVLSAGGLATAIKVSSTKWVISGTGVV